MVTPLEATFAQTRFRPLLAGIVKDDTPQQKSSTRQQEKQK
jgi:hypothetical protein